MRINYVKAARKDQGVCGACLKPITKGESYRWIKGRYGPKRSRHADCANFRASDMTSSDKLSRLYQIQENISDVSESAELSELAAALEEGAGEAEEVGQEYNESADSQEEYFPGSYQVDEIREKGEACETWASELQDAASEVEQLADEVTELDEAAASPDEDRTTTEIGEEREQKIEEARSRAQDAADSLEL